VVSRRVDLCSNYDDTKLIVEYCKRLEDAKELGVGLVIIETVNRVLAGGDENSPKDMGALVDRFAFIQAETGAAIDAVHHIPADGTQRLRGHGALLGACDATDRVEKIGNLRGCTVDKANDGPEGERVVFDLQSVELHFDEETGIATTAPVVVPAEAAAFPTDAEKPKPLANSVKIARDCLVDVLAREGRVPPRNAHIPPETPTASEASWRADCYARGISKGASPRAGQMAFASAAQSLQAKGLIGRWEGECWLINKN
jgi:AAA domain